MDDVTLCYIPLVIPRCASTTMALRAALSASLLSLLLAVALGQLLQQQPGVQQIEPVSDICLGCICEAASNCNRTLGCTGDVCGLFKITYPYWLDANKPVIPLDNPQDAGAYTRCTQDAVCAAEAVKNYMSKFAQDCNSDGAINCLDYAAIHRLGGYGCRAPIEPEYVGRFNECLKNVALLSPNIDVRQGQPPVDTF